MKHFNKKTTTPVIIVLAFLTIFFLLANRPPDKNLNNDENNQNISPEDKNKLSNRDVAIKEALESPDSLRRTEINGETYILTGYSESDAYKENKPGWALGGIIVFKIENGLPTLFWESQEFINSGKTAIFKDINNDGINEIVWEGSLDRGRRNISFYVYKFAGDEFKIVTPIDIGTSFTLLSGHSSLTYMKDIDNDGIQEIVVGRNEDISGNFDIRQQYQQTYKFNGQVYELWKEEKVPN